MSKKRKIEFLTLDEFASYISWKRAGFMPKVKVDPISGLKTTLYTDENGYFLEVKERRCWSEKYGAGIEHICTEWEVENE